MIGSDQFVTALATSAVPSFAALGVEARFNELNHRIEDSKDVLRAEMFRIEQVLDARLKHLEEHLR